jgi:hypothetical protein
MERLDIFDSLPPLSAYMARVTCITDACAGIGLAFGECGVLVPNRNLPCLCRLRFEKFECGRESACRRCGPGKREYGL